MQIEVNFLFQIVAFHQFKRENEISANAQALWLELVGLFNARRFPAEMPVSTTHLCTVLCVSKDTILRARRELEALGLITVERGVRGRASSVIAMRYFTRGCGKPVENHEKSVENLPDSVDNDGKTDKSHDDFREKADGKADEKTDTPACVAYSDANCGAKPDASLCDANMDATCGAKLDANLCVAKNGAYLDARCDTNPGNGAGCVEICDPYINYKPTVKRNVPKTCMRNDDDEEEAAATLRARARESEDHFHEVTEMGDGGSEDSDFALVSSAMMKSFGRSATREEARTLVSYARIQKGVCDYTPLIPLALELAAKYGARAPSPYAMTLMNRWRRHHLMTREDVENYMMLEGYCRDMESPSETREAAEKELDALYEDCFKRWMSKSRAQREGGAER